MQQSIGWQTDRCPYHNKKWDLDDVSLVVDHQCTKDMFPSSTIQVLNDHSDEVWFCRFSPDGTKLATGSKDNNLIIWDVHPVSLLSVLFFSYSLRGVNNGVIIIFKSDGIKIEPSKDFRGLSIWYFILVVESRFQLSDMLRA